ncbi:MAG TPA: HigA family addiction module antitoxin [Thermoanaerobaculia bacterium]
MKKLKPVTPGELLREEFLIPMGISQYRLAKEIGVPAQRIGEIVAGKRAITADTDLRLCRFLGLSNGYWLRAQAAYDTEVAEDVSPKRSIGSSRGRGRPRSIPWTNHDAR